MLPIYEFSSSLRSFKGEFFTDSLAISTFRELSMKFNRHLTEGAVLGCSIKSLFWEILQNYLENIEPAAFQKISTSLVLSDIVKFFKDLNGDVIFRCLLISSKHSFWSADTRVTFLN